MVRGAPISSAMRYSSSPFCSETTKPSGCEATRERLQRLKRVRRLHGEQHLAQRPIRLVRRRDRHLEPRLPIAGQAQPTGPHGVDMRAVRLDEAHRVAGPGQRRADDRADCAGADDDEFAHRSCWVNGMWVRPQCEPPVTSSIAPVIQPARSEARNTTASATSSGCPVRPSGVPFSIMLM